MVESVDTKDLKSFGYCSCAGSSPASSTKKIDTLFAEVAQLVEHNLAKVRVAGSSPVFRSASKKALLFFGTMGLFTYLLRQTSPLYPIRQTSPP